MNSIEKIEYMQSLENKKKELVMQYRNVSGETAQYQNSCDHINVVLGYKEQFPFKKCRCLLCGKRESFLSKYSSVHAESYLAQYDVDDYGECDKKFELIQIMALEIMKDVPELEGEELVEYINSYIQKCILDQQSDELMLCLNKRVGFWEAT